MAEPDSATAEAPEPQLPQGPDAPSAEAIARASEPFRGPIAIRRHSQPAPFAYDPDEPPPPSPEAENPYADFRADPDAPEPDLRERFRLNAHHAFWTGTLAGAGRLAYMAHVATSEPDAKETPQDKAERETLRKQYGRIVADLARYDAIRPWGTNFEGATALAGQILGTLPSPESVIGVPARGATWIGRTVKAAFQQGAVMGAVDPAVQWLQRQGGTATEYDPFRTLTAMGMGVVIGGGVHAAGELIHASALKRRFAELSRDDPQFLGAREMAHGAEGPPSPDAVYDRLRRLRDGDPEMASWDDAESLKMAETVKGKADDDLRVLAKQVSDNLAAEAAGVAEAVAPAEIAPKLEGEAAAAQTAATAALDGDLRAIQTDIGNQLRAAGVPGEDADIQGAVVAARYQVRAARLGLGQSPLDLYREAQIEARAAQEPGRLEFLTAKAKELGVDLATAAEKLGLTDPDTAWLPPYWVGKMLMQGRRPKGADLFAEREAEGQMGLPGTERIGQGEQAQRKADESLKPKVAQKPMDEGLFGDEAKQKSFFQSAPTFYSAVEKTIANAKQEKASPEQWQGMLKNAPGVKSEEMEWLGLNDWLKGQKGSVSKQEIVDYIRANAIEVKEVEKAERPETDATLAERRRAFMESNPLPEDVAEFDRLERQRRAMGSQLAPTKFATYQLPGGENYRELLLTLPESGSVGAAQLKMNDAFRKQTEAIAEYKRLIEEKGNQGDPEVKAARERWLSLAKEADKASEEFKALRPEQFKSSHWDEPNVLAHIRFNDRTIDGKRTLFVEEIQSDWHQQGRKKGYRPEQEAKLAELVKERDAIGKELHDLGPNAPYTPEHGRRIDRMNELHDQIRELGLSDVGVPDAPFKTSWPELSLKRMIRYAAENGYEKIAWTPGNVQAARYDLSKHIKEIEYIKRGYVTEGGKPVDTYELGVTGLNGEGITLPNKGRMTLAQIEETLGKEMAEKIEKGEGRKFRGHEGYTLEGLDLKVGGEGMRAFYDRELVNNANKLGKKFGAKVSKADLATSDVAKTPRTTSEDTGYWVEASGHREGPFATFEEAETARKAAEDRRQPLPVHTLDITPQLAEAAVGQGFPLFQEGLEGAPRGRIIFGPDNKKIIELFKSADRSTFMHEMGHLWLNELADDAGRENVPQALKDDLGTVLRWLGVDKAENIATEHHEQWARGFEQYLMEGKAPSSALERAFAAFKDWLTAIYRKLASLQAPITDDIRNVMDRMLATDEEIAAKRGEALAGEAKPAEAPAATPETPAPQPPAIDTSHDVRSGAVASKDPNGPVFIDRRIPEFSPTLKDRDGNPANLHKYLAVHEVEERKAMAAGMPYEQAHETRATPAERDAVLADGVDWKAYTHEMDGYLSTIEHEGVKNPPPDPHVDPDVAVGGKPHHHSANKADLPEVAVKAKRGPTNRDPETFSLLEFLASRGGIDPADALIGDVRALSGGQRKFVPGFGNLIRNGGLRLDRALEAAVEAGYIHDAGFATGAARTTTISDLLSAMDEEMRGQKIYRYDRKPDRVLSAEQKDVLAENARVADETLDEYFASAEIAPDSIDPALRKRTLEIMTREGERDPLAAYERAILEDEERYDRQAAIRRDTIGDLPGWDELPHDAGAAPGIGEAVAGGGGARPAGLGESAVRGPSRATGEADDGAQAARGAAPAALIPADGAQPLAARVSGATLPAEQTRAPTGTAVAAIPGAPSPQKQAAIQSLQQQAMNLAQTLGFPLRQGRVTTRGAIGEYQPGTGVVRVKEVPDFEVVAHEAGHALEHRIGPPLTNLTNQFATELAPLVANPGAYAPSQHVTEGFAEYIRRSLGNPAHAQQIAPNFTTAFRNFMEHNHLPDLTALDNASAAYRAYLNAPSTDVIGAVRRSRDDNVQGWRAVAKNVKAEGFFPTMGKMLSSAYDAVLDQNAPVARALREGAAAIKAQTGALVDLKAADNPEVLLRMLGRTQQAAVLDLMDGVRPYQSVTPTGPSLRAAIGKATGDVSGWGKWDETVLAQFSDYLIARRAAVLWDKFNAGELPRPPAAFSRADAITAMADFERTNPNLRAASDMVHGYTRELLRKQFDAGLIDADLYGQLLKEQFYVPFMRDLSDKPKAGGGAGASPQGPGMTQTVKRLQGSSRDIIDPLESIIMQTFLVNRTVRHNDLIRSFVNFFGKAGPEGGRFVEPLRAHDAKQYTFDLGDAIERKAVAAGMSSVDAKLLASSVSHQIGEDPLVGSFFRMEPTAPKGEPLVFYKDGGALKVARFMSAEEGHGLYELVTSLPSGLSDVVLQGLSTSSGLLRTGIVTNPTFILTNFIRDQVAAGILRPDYIPFYHGAKGVAAEVKEGQSAALYGYAGGVSAGAKIAPLEQAADMQIQALKRKGYLTHRIQDLHGLLELASLTEAGTRNSIFETVFTQKKAQGLSDNEAMIEAAYQAQDILDFSRWGSRTQAVRALTPFVNAHLQGLDKARRVLFEPITRRLAGNEVLTTDRPEFNNAMLAWGKLLGVGGVLGAAWAALHHNDPIYNNASPEIKGTHFVTSLGGYMAVIPKPFELSLGFTAGEYAFRQFAQEDQRAAAQFAEAAYEVIKPPVPVFDNPLLKTSYELYFGKSAFTNRDLVPDALKRLAPAEQYTDRTTSMAKAIGAAIGVSPIKVDHAIGGYLGTWGRDIATMSSGVDEDSPVSNWADTVLVRRFIKDPTRSSDVTTKFWGFMGQTSGKFNQAVNTYDSMVKQFREADAKTFLDKLPNAERSFVTLKSAANEDGKPAFGANEKRLHPLQRAYDAVTMLNGVRREMDKNTFAPFGTGENQKLNPLQRGLVRDATRELAQAEMMNALVILKEPGYGKQPMVDLNPIMEKIRKVSPAVADELVTRYATSRIYPTQAVALAYPSLQRELLRSGSEADLGGLVADAQADGYEFGGERVRRPPKRRLPIAPTPLHLQ